MRKFSSSLGHRFTAVVIILLLFLLSASAVFALGSSKFESLDGNLRVDNVADPEATAWANAPNRVMALDKPSGTNDDSFKRAKEDDPAPVIDVGSIPKNKSDLLRFYVANEQVGDDDYLYLGWVRGNTEGSTNMDFEFNQSPDLSINGVTPVRMPNDILITFQLGGSDQVVLGMSRWLGVADAGACEASASKPCWGEIVPLDGSDGSPIIAEGAVNSTMVTDHVAGGNLEPMTFGEAAINLTAAGVFNNNSNECVVFGSAYLKSRSSDSFTASMKDFISPISVSVSNCATLTITKNAEPNDIKEFFFSTQDNKLPTFSLVDD